MRKLILLLVVVSSAMIVNGQNNLLFFNFEHVNQNLLVNPSNPHPYRFTIGIPGLSGVSVHIRNTLFPAGDILNDNTGNENIDNIINNLDGTERLSLYQSTDLLFAGFGLKQGYVSFGIQQEASFNMNVPASLLKVIWFGNKDQPPLSFSNNSFNAEALIQINYHVGYQHWLLDSSLVVGGRFKYISGTAHTHFSRFNMYFNSSIVETSIKTDISLETSGYEYIDNYDSFNPIEQINSGNPGYGIDLGATYLLPKMKISAAVLNIGKITWNQRIKNYQSKGEFNFDGLEIDGEGNVVGGDFALDSLIDVLDSTLGFKEVSPYSYSSKLPMRFMVSYEYQVHPKHAFGVTYQGTSWSGNLYHNFGVNYLGRWHKRINFILGYGRLSGGLNNIGAGISAALGPVQLYLMSDNVWGALKPSELSAFNLRVGLNLVFFDRKPKKVEEEDIKNL